MRFQERFINSLKGPLSDLLDLRTEAITSYYMDQSPVQDSFRYRAKYLGLRVASLLIDDQGELNQGRQDELLRLLNEAPFIQGPNREGDLLIYSHLRTCLHSLNKEIWTAIRKFSPPLCHKKAEEIIRETLWPEPIRVVQTVHVRRAVMAAWFTLLRQASGSCFATAPAILIQRDRRFFKDLYDLLTTGQLKRTVGGKQYAVPLSFSIGKGDLQRPAPLLEISPGVSAALQAGGVVLTAGMQQKIREQGAQTPEQLLRSVLLESVGLSEEDLQDEEHLARIQIIPSGIYYQRPTERAAKVSDWKKKFAKACTTFQTLTECALLRAWEYTIASFCDVKTDFARWNLYTGLGIHPDYKEGIGAFLYEQIDGRLQQCNQDIGRLAREYEREIGIMNMAHREGRKAEFTAAEVAANSILDARNHLISQAEGLAKFFPSLLEQYDQKLQEYFQELFDPSLLGEEAHILDDSSAGFRLVYKHGRPDASQWTPIYTGEQYIDCLREFFSTVENDLAAPPQMGSEITTALIQFIQQPEFLASALRRSKEIGKRSPWDYISGGTLQTLLMAYCNRDIPFTELSITPHSEEELLRFLMSVKREGPLLMHSPTHAFVLSPNFLVHESKVKGVQWDELMQEHLAHLVMGRLPEEEKALFIHLYRQKPTAATNVQFRIHLIETVSPRIKNRSALVDSVLYEQTPLLSQSQANEAIVEVLRALGRDVKREPLNGSFFGPLDVYQAIQAALFTHPFSSTDWDLKIAETMHHLGFAQPYVFLFADTNWSAWFFGFVKNPATGHLELWRLNRNATRGASMTDWQQWLGDQNTTPWIVLSNPQEY